MLHLEHVGDRRCRRGGDEREEHREYGEGRGVEADQVDDADVADSTPVSSSMRTWLGLGLGLGQRGLGLGLGLGLGVGVGVGLGLGLGFRVGTLPRAASYHRRCRACLVWVRVRVKG